MSTTLILANLRHGVPAEERVVRSNTFVVKADTPPSEQQGAPEFNEVETDPNPDLGMVPRNKASMWVEGQQFVPWWLDHITGVNDAIQTRVNDRQAEGHSADRVREGHFGHGTLSYAVGIEPVQDLQGFGGYGADYFTVDKKSAQEFAGDYTTSPIVDRDVQVRVAAAGREGSRAAIGGSWEADWYQSLVGGSK